MIRSLIVMRLGAALTVAGGTAAISAESDPGTVPKIQGIADEPGVDFDSTPYDLSIADEAGALRDLCTLYGQMLSGEASAAQLESKITIAQSKVEKATGQKIAAIAPAPNAASVPTLGMSKSELAANVDAAAAGVNRLGVAYAGQQTNYYCGPATGYMILKYKGKTKSAADSGLSLSQNNLAGSGYMKTSAQGSTNWGSGDLPRGINKWYGATYLRQINSPSRNTLMGAVVTNVINKKPVASATYEGANGSHYNKHPRAQTVRHWVATYGYAANGDLLYMKDPSAAIWSSYGVASDYTSTASAWGSYLSSYGIAS